MTYIISRIIMRRDRILDSEFIRLTHTILSLLMDQECNNIDPSAIAVNISWIYRLICNLEIAIGTKEWMIGGTQQRCRSLIELAILFMVDAITDRMMLIIDGRS
jgi:hypothetical protein